MKKSHMDRTRYACAKIYCDRIRNSQKENMLRKSVEQLEPRRLMSGWALATVGDITNDGIVDQVWRNADTGENKVLVMGGYNGGQAIRTEQIKNQSGTSWNFVGIGDINGDGWNDLVYQDVTNDVTGFWTMAGTNYLGNTTLSDYETTWRIIGVANFNGDSRYDIVWHDTSTGTNGAWLMITDSTYGWQSFSNTSNSWSLRGIGDFFTGSNPDGAMDLLWYDNNNQMYLWKFTDTTYGTYSQLSISPQSPTTGYQPIGVGKMNSDQNPDIIFTDTLGSNPTSSTRYWLMTGTSRSGSEGYAPTGPAGNQWVTTAVGDLNNDGYVDNIWRNYATGQNRVEYLNGTWNQLVVEELPSNTSLSWSIAAVADFDNDGKNDLVAYDNVSGQVQIWTMNGSTRYSVTDVYNISDGYQQFWNIAGVSDVNGDGHKDIIWHNTSLGTTTAWHMNRTTKGTTYTGYATISSSANWKLVSVADLDGDSVVDFIWRSTTDGRMDWWKSCDINQSSSLSPSTPDAGYTLMGAGNWDGNSKADLVFADDTVHGQKIWTMNGSTRTNSIALLGYMVSPAGLTLDSLVGNMATLSWTNKSLPEIGFEIQRSTSSSFNANLVTVSLDASRRHYVDNTVPVGTVYYRIRAKYSSTLNSGYSPTLTVTNSGVSLTAPKNVAASINSNRTQMTVTWSDLSSNETGYLIQTSVDGLNFVDMTTTAANATSATISGLTGNNLYYVRVRAKYGMSTSEYVNTVLTIPTDAVYINNHGGNITRDDLKYDISQTDEGDVIVFQSGAYNLGTNYNQDDSFAFLPNRTYIGFAGDGGGSGTDDGRAIISGYSAYADVAKIEGSNVRLFGFSFVGGGIYIDNHVDTSLSKITIDYCHFTCNHTISGNNPDFRISSIKWASGGLVDSVISNNSFTGLSSDYSIFGNNCTNVRILCNQFSDINGGIKFMGFSWYNSSNLHIEQNYISGAHGLGVEIQEKISFLDFNDNYYVSPAEDTGAVDYAFSLPVDRSTDVVIMRNKIVAEADSGGLFRHGFEIGGGDTFAGGVVNKTIVSDNYVLGTGLWCEASDNDGEMHVMVTHNYVDGASQTSVSTPWLDSADTAESSNNDSFIFLDWVSRGILGAGRYWVS